MDPELHLFLLWEHSQPKWNEILLDMKQRFEILKVFQVKWSQKHFIQNLKRFYGVKIQIANQKEKHCGNGPFLLIIVKDPSPSYANRKTSHGVQKVNVNTFDAKQLYRKWTGGGHRVHGTTSLKETNHDLALLLGTDSINFQQKYSPPWNGETETLHSDLVGTNGWESLEQLLFVLNHTLNYVVLRNFECIPKNYTMESHGDIDILTDNYDEFSSVTNALKVFPVPYRVHHKINIAGENVPFDFRFVGDGYYDQNWQKDILKNKRLNERNFYVPNAENYFYSLLYHALIHKRMVAKDYKKKLLNLANIIKIQEASERTFNDSQQMKAILDNYLNEKNYRYTKPIDSSVYFNHKLIGEIENARN